MCMPAAPVIQAPPPPPPPPPAPMPPPPVPMQAQEVAKPVSAVSAKAPKRPLKNPLAAESASTTGLNIPM